MLYFIVFCLLDLVLMDPPFGLNVAHWDKKAVDRDELGQIIRSLRVLNGDRDFTFVIHHAMESLAMTKEVLEKNSFSHIYTTFWCKPK